MKHIITIILIITGLKINAQTFDYYKKQIDQYSKHKVVFDDKVYQAFLEQANLVNFENCIGKITNEQMSSKTDSLLKIYKPNFNKKTSKNDLYNYKVLNWQNSRKCIEYKLTNKIPFKEYEEPKDFYTKKERQRIKEYQVVFENKKLEKYAYAYHNLKIKATKDYWDNINYDRELKKVNRKIHQIKDVSPSDAHNFSMLMSKTSLLQNDLATEQTKKLQIIKKQISQLYATNIQN